MNVFFPFNPFFLINNSKLKDNISETTRQLIQDRFVYLCLLQFINSLELLTN